MIRRRLPLALLLAGALAACAPGGITGQTVRVPIPPPDSLPTQLRGPADSIPRLDYVLVAFDDSVTAEARGRILATVDGVVEGGLPGPLSLPPSYIVRVPPAADRAALAALTDRLRSLPGVFAAGMWGILLSP